VSCEIFRRSDTKSRNEDDGEISSSLDIQVTTPDVWPWAAEKAFDQARRTKHFPILTSEGKFRERESVLAS
jgi:hypothetical protein